MSYRPPIGERCPVCDHIVSRKCPVCRVMGSDTGKHTPDGRMLCMCNETECHVSLFAEGDFMKFFEKNHGNHLEHLKHLDV